MDMGSHQIAIADVDARRRHETGDHLIRLSEIILVVWAATGAISINQRRLPAAAGPTASYGEFISACQKLEPGTVISKMTPGHLFIKGANAIDPFGNAGVIMAGPGGGTMGQFYMALKAQGVMTIYPVGLEKLIPSVEEAARYGGKMVLGRSIGCRVGMALVADGRIVTEIEAIEILFDLKAVHYASGGWGGAEGSVTLIVEGEEKDVNRCLDFIEGIKGEPPLPAAKRPCKGCGAPCSFSGKDVQELPAYLR